MKKVLILLLFIFAILVSPLNTLNCMAYGNGYSYSSSRVIYSHGRNNYGNYYGYNDGYYSRGYNGGYYDSGYRSYNNVTSARRHPIKEEKQLNYLRKYYQAVNSSSPSNSSYRGNSYQNGNKIVNVNVY